MLKFPWSLERTLITGCLLGIFGIVALTTLVNRHTASQADASVSSAENDPSPDESSTPQVVPAGTQAPSFDSTTLDGHPFRSTDLNGHVSVLDFWATWCGPCRMAIPSVQDLHARYASQGVRVVGVSLDTNSAPSVRPYVASMKMTYPVLLNPSRNEAAAQLYGADGLPSIYVIDKHGIIRWSADGYFPGEEDVISRNVERLLKEK